MSICLSMIVRNEAAIIERCLRSVMPLIDHWIIYDTGSLDQTIAIINRTMLDIPGQVVITPWVNFGHNRTEAMRLARESGCDYVLILDADMTVDISPRFSPFDLTADSYLLRYTGPLDYAQTMLVSARHDWRFIGPTHEYIHSDTAQPPVELNGLLLTHHGDGAMRPEKLRRDIELLHQALEDDPNNARSIFYLAQTYRDFGNIEAALVNYRRRVSLGGWSEETWYAQFQIARLKDQMQVTQADLIDSYLAAYAMRPSRAEPLYYLGRALSRRQQYAIADLSFRAARDIRYPQSDKLFIERDIYDYLLALEYAVVCYYLGRHAEAVEINSQLLVDSRLPQSLRERVEQNRAFSLSLKQ